MNISALRKIRNALIVIAIVLTILLILIIISLVTMRVGVS